MAVGKEKVKSKKVQSKKYKLKVQSSKLKVKNYVFKISWSRHF